MKLLLIPAVLLLLAGCWHPLEIRGRGHIVERIYGERGCSLNEFESASIRCTENRVVGERYLVSYEAVPEPGWEFVGWEGLACRKESVWPYCEYDVSREAIEKVAADNPDLVLPATVAVFREVQIGEVPLEDLDLRRRIDEHDLDGDPRRESVPSIWSPLAQLGMRLFFSKSLSGKFDTACASCHHPALAGGDALSLPIGTDAVEPDLLGPGREHQSGRPQVGRHSQTTFNASMYRFNIFWDGRIKESFSGIATPDTGPGRADPDAGPDKLSAQARFPVTEPDEMLSHDFMPGAGSEAIRRRLAARIGDYGEGAGEIENNNWLPLFEAAFGEGIPRRELVSFDNIALAISVYQQSQVFINNPWNAYVRGDYDAISKKAKLGAQVFMADPAVLGGRGGGCIFCHDGDFFSNEQFEAVGFPQIGPGKGSKGASRDEDLGRGALFEGSSDDDYRFRNPSLLNVAATAPYGHAGAFATLREAVAHYGDTVATLNKYWSDGGWCQLEQFADVKNCGKLYPDARANTDKAFDKVLSDRPRDRAMPETDLSDKQVDQLVAFLESLTDPCVQDRECLSPWIPDAEGAPDPHQLNAINRRGKPL